MSVDRHRVAAYYLLTPMTPTPKRILVVSHDTLLRSTRVAILERAGYSVMSVATDDDAMKLLETEQFDLVLIGRKSESARLALDQRLREKYPKLPVLKIQPRGDAVSDYSSRTTDALPEHVVDALKDMLD
jgi:DNA-binding NtrC family response regulator